MFGQKDKEVLFLREEMSIFPRAEIPADAVSITSATIVRRWPFPKATKKQQIQKRNVEKRDMKRERFSLKNYIFVTNFAWELHKVLSFT